MTVLFTVALGVVAIGMGGQQPQPEMPEGHPVPGQEHEVVIRPLALSGLRPVPPVAGSDVRCRECNMTLAGVGGRPAAFTRQSVWFWAAALLVIYLVVLAIVAAAR